MLAPLQVTEGKLSHPLVITAAVNTAETVPELIGTSDQLFFAAIEALDAQLQQAQQRAPQQAPQQATPQAPPAPPPQQAHQVQLPDQMAEWQAADDHFAPLLVKARRSPGVPVDAGKDRQGVSWWV
jgi:hypothetical protein